MVDGAYVAYSQANKSLAVTPPAMTVVPSAASKKKLGGVVRLMTPEGHTYCSGSVVNNTTIITAGHCVLDESPMGVSVKSDPIEVRAEDGIARGTYGRVHYLAPQLDQAVLKGNFRIYTKFNYTDDIGAIDKLRDMKTNFIACGYPMGGSLFCNTLNYVGPAYFMWQMRGLLLPGMSGGPVVTPDGKQIAINDAVTESSSVVSPIYNIHAGF
jgi:hypothetical protein